MSLVGKLQNDYFLVLKFRQSLKCFSQNMVLDLIIVETLRHRSAKDADDELILVVFFEGKPKISWRSYKPEVRMKLVVKRPGLAVRLGDFKLSRIGLDAIVVYRI